MGHKELWTWQSTHACFGFRTEVKPNSYVCFQNWWPLFHHSKWKHLYMSISLTFNISQNCLSSFEREKTAVKLQSNTSLPFLPGGPVSFSRHIIKPGTGSPGVTCGHRLMQSAVKSKTTAINKLHCPFLGALLKTTVLCLHHPLHTK